jgi:uncharacterized membrane protein
VSAGSPIKSGLATTVPARRRTLQRTEARNRTAPKKRSMRTPDDRPSLPDHLEETVRSVARLNAEHSREASPYQRAIEQLIERISSPGAVVAIGGFIACWIAANLLLLRLHMRGFDGPPFQYLQGLMTAGALLMTVFILTVQRRENRLAERRAQLTLELSMVTEGKVAKVIELLGTDRPNAETPGGHTDTEAAAMAKPADPHAISHAVRETHAEMLAEDDTK